MRGATILCQELGVTVLISIHAPHARSDITANLNLAKAEFQSTLLMRGATRLRNINARHAVISIHAPHARSDAESVVKVTPDAEFQSTLLMRGATSS